MAYTTPGMLTDESRWLANIARLTRMNIHSAIQNAFPFAAAFTIGDGGGSTPTNGATTYTNAALTTMIKVYKNGVQLAIGTNYTYASTTITLVGSTFKTGENYVVLYQ